ncbi:MAG: transposase [Actinomadura sp.]
MPQDRGLAGAWGAGEDVALHRLVTFLITRWNDLGRGVRGDGRRSGRCWNRCRPGARERAGSPKRSKRQLTDGIRWRVRGGAPWRDLPGRDGPWETAYCLFRLWPMAPGRRSRPTCRGMRTRAGRAAGR